MTTTITTTRKSMNEISNHHNRFKTPLYPSFLRAYSLSPQGL
jgi:hypothetical protein